MPDGSSQGPQNAHVHGAHQPGRKSTTDASASQSRQTEHCSGTAGTAANPVLTAVLTEEHATWLEERAIDPEIAVAHGLRSAVVLGQGSWFGIPYGNGAVQFRRTDEKQYRWQQGSALDWWNKDAITDTTLSSFPLVVTEGVLDALSVLSAGHPRVVSVPVGAPSTEDTEGNRKYQFIADSLDILRDVETIILAVDGDAPGMNLMHDLAIRLGKRRCKYVEYPDNAKDPNDVALRYGHKALAAVLNGAKWCRVTGLYRMEDLPPAPDRYGISTMMPGLSDYFRMRKGDFTVITGVPGSGKSTIVNDICCRMAKHHQWRTCFASFEQKPQTDHKRALRTWFCRKPEKDCSAIELTKADAWINAYFSFIVPPIDEDASMAWVLERMSAAVVRYGADICVIDPWNEMDHDRPRDVSMTDYVGLAIRQIKRFAPEWDVHFIVVAHPAKIKRDNSGTMPEPTLYDIADSAHFFNKPDVGIVIHPARDEQHGEHTRVIVKKVRYRDQIGKPGLVRMTYDRYTAKFQAVMATM